MSMRKILVIEDGLEILENIREMLTEAGWRVHCATNGIDGISTARTVLPDLVLCDVMMPGCDGYDVLSALRADAATASIPLLFLTARTDRGSMRKGMEMGAEDYITKPFTRTELLAAVQARMERSEFLSERFRTQMQDLRETIARSLPPQLLSPLNGILGLSSILVEEYESIKRRELHEMARSIEESGHELHRIVRKFLTFSELAMVRMDPCRIESLRRDNLCRIDEVGERTLRLLSGSRGEGERIRARWEHGLVSMSPFHYQRLLEELMENALIHSPPGSPVSIGVRARPQCVQIAIENAAQGEAQSRLREGSQPNGMGVGIARAICEMYGGTLRYESSPGEWTIAHVELPLLQV
jgi:CheY-like chemotaxis protein